EKIAPLPAEQRPKRHDQQERHEQRTESRIEEGRADRDLLAGQRFERERIKRADENRRARAGQKQIIEDQRALARDRREQAALFEERPAPSIEHERAADKGHQDGEDENAASRIGGERMHRGEHARSHQEGSDQRQRESKDRKQDRPHFERTALFHHHGGMQKRG